MSAELTAQEKIDQQIAHFDSIAETYRRARGHANHLHLKHLIWQTALHDPAVAELCRDRSRLDVLEPMCGYCDGKAILEDHLPLRLNYRGFDYSASIVETLHTDRPTLDVWRQDVTSYRPLAGSLDIVILLGGLHHVPDAAETVVGNLAHGLRPGGLFINFEPTYGNPLTKLVRRRIYAANELFDAATERDFGVRELAQLFATAGLTHQTNLYPGLLAYVLYYNPDAFPSLNRGGPGLVDAAFALDRLFQRNAIGRILSFATLSIWQRPKTGA